MHTINPLLSQHWAFWPIPQHYLVECGAFLLKCNLVFDQQPMTYATDMSHFFFYHGLPSGQASGQLQLRIAIPLSVTLIYLVDSGADDDLIYSTCPHVTHCTFPGTYILSGNHRDQ